MCTVFTCTNTIQYIGFTGCQCLCRSCKQNMKNEIRNNIKIYQRYLSAVEQSGSVPLTAFKIWCEKQLSVTDELFSRIFIVHEAVQDLPKHFTVSIRDKSLYDQFFSRFSYHSLDNKVNAALHGDSKKAKTDGGILNFKHQFFDQQGVSVCFYQGNTDFKPTSTNLLLIENQNNFLNPNGVFVGITEDYLDCNVIWSRGNDITSSQYKSFLDQYKSVTCFLDYDLGGFGAFKKLRKSLESSVKLTFYHPKALSHYLTLFGNSISDKQLLSLRKYLDEPELEKIVRELLSLTIDGRRAYRFLEQEALQISLENSYDGK
jgi:hypothetical protein